VRNTDRKRQEVNLTPPKDGGKREFRGWDRVKSQPGHPVCKEWQKREHWLGEKKDDLRLDTKTSRPSLARRPSIFKEGGFVLT